MQFIFPFDAVLDWQSAMVASKRLLGTRKSKNSAKKKRQKVRQMTPIHPFQTDVLDHAETELRAYCHVAPVLKLLSKHFRLRLRDLQIWDPYFCKGTVVKHLAELGFQKVHNVNEDFYKVQETGVPESGTTVCVSGSYFCT